VCEAAGFGVEIKAIEISGFDLLDQSIMQDLAKITRARIAVKSARVKGEQSIAEAEAEKNAQEKRAEAEAHVQLTKARSKAEVMETEAAAAARARVAAVRAESEGEKLKLDIETRRMRETAEAEAAAILTLAQANYEKQIKEHEAASRIPQHEIDIRMADSAVEAVKGYGAAAFAYDQQRRSDMSTVMRQFLPLLRVGPAPMSEFSDSIPPVSTT
jgi:hypothetical protein